MHLLGQLPGRDEDQRERVGGVPPGREPLQDRQCDVPVRAVGLRHDDPEPTAPDDAPPGGAEMVVLAERRHLRMIADAEER